MGFHTDEYPIIANYYPIRKDFTRISNLYGIIMEIW